MSVDLRALTLDAEDPEVAAAFWGRLLGREVESDEDQLLLTGSPTQVGLGFLPETAPRVGPDRVHLHLTSDAGRSQGETVRLALDLGAVHVDVGQRPEESHVVLADREGNLFCVIAADNAYLAGTGYLGEVACDGTRDVGLFWAAALDWPLVWEQGEETAVQSPAGGTKVAWGGPPVTPRRGRARQRLDLTTDDLGLEIERLLDLGATRVADLRSGVELADPDGNEFLLRSSRRRNSSPERAAP